MPEGKVKWFSHNKGYGFITPSTKESRRDYFFHISSVVGPEPPRDGDLVVFIIGRGRKGDEAKEVEIVQRYKPKPTVQRNSPPLKPIERRDDRLVCKHCGRRMVPKIQFRKGEPYRRICPYCMESQESCFIATATFDDRDHPTVRALREFRDTFLVSTRWGPDFIRTYYSISPGIAKVLETRTFFKPVFKVFLTLLAQAIRIVFRPSPMDR